MKLTVVNVKKETDQAVTISFKNNRIFKATLGGCIIEKVNQTVIISKEN